MPEKLAVLLCTYNGERFIRDQLDSIENQSFKNVSLHVSDDGSTDGTLAILQEFKDRWSKGNWTLVNGPQKGFAENFRSAIQGVDLSHDYYAFCDQDDLWDIDKLAHAVNCLGDSDSIPQLYSGRTRLIDAEDNTIGHSPLFKRPAAFRNAIIQSLAGGNTMVFNRAAMQILKKAAANAPFVAHDWWVYQIVSGVGGTVIYDPVPQIGYRQHADNEIGANSSLRARFVRLRGLLRGTLKEWNTINLVGLYGIWDELTEEAKTTVKDIETIRSSGLIARLVCLHRSGIYRQTLAGQAGLYLAALLARL